MRNILIAIIVALIGIFSVACTTQRVRERAERIFVEESRAEADAYLDGLVEEGKITAEEADAIRQRARERFAPEHVEAR